MRLVSRDSDLLRVHGGQEQPYISPNEPCAGMVRYNNALGCLEVNDGVSWRRLAGDMEIELNPQIRETVEWVRRKQQEETELQKLCAQHPGLQEAWDRFRLMQELVRQQNFQS